MPTQKVFLKHISEVKSPFFGQDENIKVNYAGKP